MKTCNRGTNLEGQGFEMQCQYDLAKRGKNKMDKREEFLSLLFKVIDKPGLYFGKNRMDYFGVFLSGYFSGDPDAYNWNGNYELEKWLFVNYSASINSASIASRTLFIRVFGNEMTAFSVFKKMIKEVPFEEKEKDKPTKILEHEKWEIKDYIESYERKGHSPIQQKYKKHAMNIKEKYNCEASFDEKVEILIEEIERSIPEYEKLNMFLCYSKYYIEFRFSYKNRNGDWISDETVFNEGEYLEKNMVIHAYLQMIIERNDYLNILYMEKQSGEPVKIDRNQQDDLFQINNYDAGDMTFDELYLQWKNKL